MGADAVLTLILAVPVLARCGRWRSLLHRLTECGDPKERGSMGIAGLGRCLPLDALRIADRSRAPMPTSCRLRAQGELWLESVHTTFVPHTMDSDLAAVNARLASRTFLLGHKPTLADLVLYTTLSPAIVRHPVARHRAPPCASPACVRPRRGWSGPLMGAGVHPTCQLRTTLQPAATQSVCAGLRRMSARGALVHGVPLAWNTRTRSAGDAVAR